MGKKTPKGGYEVGYGKPPIQTQVKKGQSGNPSGKSKGAQNLVSLIQTIGAEPIIVSEAGEKKQILKNEAVAKAVYAKAMKGDVAAARLLVAMSEADGVAHKSTLSGFKVTQADIDTLKRHADWVKLLEEAEAEVEKDQAGKEDGSDAHTS